MSSIWALLNERNLSSSFSALTKMTENRHRRFSEEEGEITPQETQKSPDTVSLWPFIKKIVECIR